MKVADKKRKLITQMTSAAYGLGVRGLFLHDSGVQSHESLRRARSSPAVHRNPAESQSLALGTSVLVSETQRRFGRLQILSCSVTVVRDAAQPLLALLPVTQIAVPRIRAEPQWHFPSYGFSRG